MKNKDQIRIVSYLVSSISNLDEYIEKAFVNKLGKEKGPSKHYLANCYFKPFLKAKITTELYKLDPEIEKKEIEKRENNWERLCHVLDENFGPYESLKVRDAYTEMAKKQVQVEILSGTNKAQRHKVNKEVMQEMDYEL